MTPLHYDTPIDEVIVRIEANLRNPNIGEMVSVPLKSGPQAYRLATLYQIVNPETKAHHHWCLKISSVSRTKKNGWTFKTDKSVSLDDDNSTELSILADLLRKALAQELPKESGEYHLVPASRLESIRTLVRAAKDANGEERLRVVRLVLENLEVGAVPASEWLAVFTSGKEGVRQTIAVSARLAEYRGVRERLAEMISVQQVSEGRLQALLAEHPWLFGSEYSELMTRRAWTRDQRLDFMLRRTADGYLEIIEIKTPFKQPLFRHDPSHDSYAPSATLSEAIGQVIRYLEETERGRDSIIAHDACDPLKIRARVIIGRDGTPEQQVALREFNAHLYRIEVLTFDQLLRIADRVLSVFQDKLAEG